jgi:hypothetical protein
MNPVSQMSWFVPVVEVRKCEGAQKEGMRQIPQYYIVDGGPSTPNTKHILAYLLVGRLTGGLPVSPPNVLQ